MKQYNIAIVGATGLVGSTFIQVINEYNAKSELPIGEIRLFASERSAGKELEILGRKVKVQKLEEGCFEGLDIALFSAGASTSKIWAKEAEKSNVFVIDNSSCWRMNDECALIVPEINPLDYVGKSKIIANPNCSTIQCVVPLKPLDDLYNIKRIVYTTYQACSGSGMKGLNDLRGTKEGKPNQFYPYDISKTCIPEIDVFGDDGYTKEEMKMVNETRKILHHDDIRIAATCVRVPVEFAHAVSMQIEFEKDFDLDEVRKALDAMPGCKVVDDPKNHIYPVSTMALDNDTCYVGRIRRDLSCDNGLLIYSVANNIRKGAAANAVQIMLKLIEQGI